ncbi:MAG TPA: thiamine pyrophosphate-requiring protein [Acetobacteraceae bacterium]|nr:thiamine pyrophosphate-requiring protein [Acetobacteraceae bacterium]
MPRRTAADLLIEGLLENGQDLLFANLGTDHVTIVEELARREAQGLPAPRVLSVPHENVAVHMAGGYAALTGRGQAVLVHVDAGTANAAMALHNLRRGRLPVLLMAGRAPFALRGELPAGRDTYVHYVQDPFDMAGIVRPYTKWEYCLPSGAVAKSMLMRALAVMQSDPAGPVFLTLPREILAETFESASLRDPPPLQDTPVAAGGVAPEMARRMARMLMEAEHPLIVTAYLGRNMEAPAILGGLAEEAGIRVVEASSHWMNLPQDHPCHMGFDAGALLPRTDLGMLLDVDVPWMPKLVAENPASRWIHLDVDPLKQGLPLWGFPAEIRVQADSAIVLRQILEAIRAEADDALRARVRARLAEMAKARDQRAGRLADAASNPGTKDAIAPAFLCARLHAQMTDTDIVLNEAIRNTPAVLNHMPRTRPGTYSGLAGGGLGYSGGMALGFRLARPEARVVQVIGDGGFHFSAPDAVYATAQAYGLPIFTVVMDNGGWQAVKEATLRVHPQGSAAATDRFFARLEGGRRRFEQVGMAFGAHGEYVDEPEALDAAIGRCFAAIERGQAAVMTVRVTPM